MSKDRFYLLIVHAIFFYFNRYIIIKSLYYYILFIRDIVIFTYNVNFIFKSFKWNFYTYFLYFYFFIKDLYYLYILWICNIDLLLLEYNKYYWWSFIYSDVCLAPIFIEKDLSLIKNIAKYGTVSVYNVEKLPWHIDDLRVILKIQGENSEDLREKNLNLKTLNFDGLRVPEKKGKWDFFPFNIFKKKKISTFVKTNDMINVKEEDFILKEVEPAPPEICYCPDPKEYLSFVSFNNICSSFDLIEIVRGRKRKPFHYASKFHSPYEIKRGLVFRQQFYSKYVRSKYMEWTTYTYKNVPVYLILYDIIIFFLVP